MQQNIATDVQQTISTSRQAGRQASGRTMELEARHFKHIGLLLNCQSKGVAPRPMCGAVHLRCRRQLDNVLLVVVSRCFNTLSLSLSPGVSFVVVSFNFMDTSGGWIRSEVSHISLAIVSRTTCHFEVLKRSWEAKVIGCQGAYCFLFTLSHQIGFLNCVHCWILNG